MRATVVLRFVGVNGFQATRCLPVVTCRIHTIPRASGRASRYYSRRCHPEANHEVRRRTSTFNISRKCRTRFLTACNSYGLLLIEFCRFQAPVITGSAPKLVRHLQIRLAYPASFDLDVICRPFRVRVIADTLQSNLIPLFLDAQKTHP